MFGTIITEWKDGAKLCMEMLQNSEQIERAVNILVEIAEYYRFEGWLVNIENEIAVSFCLLTYLIPVFYI